jgi:hypothetical protein
VPLIVACWAIECNENVMKNNKRKYVFFILKAFKKHAKLKII